MTGMDRIESILKGFRPIQLEGMSRVRLMNRTDTKYVTTVPQLVRLLEMAGGEYRVQETDGLRDMPYYTCYFDTPDRDMYVQHERGRKARQKIRVRVYEHSGAAFLEIKDKDNRGRTDKRRTPACGEGVMRHADFIRAHSHYLPESLLPQLRNRFHRITLVNRLLTERLTIDTDLSFHNVPTGCRRSLEGLVIIELKRDGHTRSPAAEMLRGLHIHPAGFSKYCVGMALTDSRLRQNRLKPRLRMLGRLLCPDVPYGQDGLSFNAMV